MARRPEGGPSTRLRLETLATVRRSKQLRKTGQALENRLLDLQQRTHPRKPK